MTKKLETLFNLDDSAPTKVEAVAVDKDNVRNLEQSFQEVDRISKSLPSLDGLEMMGDQELDRLADKAEAAYDDLMDLGMNVEVRYSGRIFEVAGGMLKNAIDAKAAKIDKKLKMIELQLKKQKLDQDAGQEDNGIDVTGSGVIVSDRNSLIEKLKNMNK